ncbi:MAG: hypothetical protein IRZ31_14345 [Thermogemmatispora sp.]|uniref:hypothetical protein n=1 Tax=Thermogemmatispora sp. TaxID=1968838 RepID=UPI002633BA61|nr:hypothetical protein [Thermogemmatispora sp.]MBX5458071.1 hypothetical protein [Thermogemmatispora sp.]
MYEEQQDGPALQARPDGKRYYALSGRRLYTIATLDGRFPDMGWHQPGEMGGLWAPPLKLLDGYWFGLRLAGSEETHWLTAPERWQWSAAGVTFSYTLPALSLAVERREWIVPDESALVIELTLRALPGSDHQSQQQARPLEARASKAEPHLREAAVSEVLCGLVARSDLHGAWMAEERLGWHDGEDLAEYDEELAAVVLRDALHPTWTACVGATVTPIAWQVGHSIWGPERTGGRGTGAALWYRCQVSSAGPARLSFLITGPARSAGSAADLFARLTRGGRVLGGLTPVLVEAQHRAQAESRSPFEHCVLSSPDLAFNEVFAWSKANTARLLLEVPGIGAGLMAGLPDFPWWFGCDTAYGVLPLLPIGQTEAAVLSLRTLAAFGERCDPHGSVPHEVLPYGQLWASGNLVELPLFVRALYHTYCWTGDQDLLRELFPFCLQALRAWPLADCDRRATLVPHGKSIVETPEMASEEVQALDVAAYLAEALDCLAILATELDDPGLATDLRQRAAQTRAHVRDAWWVPREGLFGDLYASPHSLRQHQNRLQTRAAEAARTSEEGEAQVLQEAAAALEQALQEQLASSDSSRAQAEEVPRPWLLYHMVQALALDAGLPSLAQASSLLARLETPEWQETCGLVLNARRNRAVMTLPSGALAVGAARYGHADQALAWMQRMSTAFGLASPGTLSEYAPDGGCFLQLWSSYGIVWPVVHYFFGLRPEVAKRRLLCIPQPPSSWPRAALRRIPLASASLDVELTVEQDSLQVQLTISEPDWELLPGLALLPNQRICEARLNGRPVTLHPVQLTGFEERTIWLAPALQQTTAYELLVRWSPSAITAGP